MTASCGNFLKKRDKLSLSDRSIRIYIIAPNASILV